MPVFSLEEARALQVKNIAQNNFKYWPESAVYGYYGGGLSGSIINTISRLDFSSEVVSDPGKNLPTARGYLAAVSSSSYGYFGGGYSPPSINTISRLDFSSEVVSDPGKNLLTARNSLAAISSSSYGYFVGGATGSVVSNISRLDFSSEVVSDPGKNLPTARYSLAATSNSSYGYFGGGANPSGALITITKFDFISETANDLSSASFPYYTQNLSATSSSSYGYFGGGYWPGVPGTFINTISRLDFSNETLSFPLNNLPSVRRNLAATSSSSYGYFGGGDQPGLYINTISRLNFSNETVSNPGKNLPTARNNIAALSGGQSINRGSKTYGYFAGGNAFPSMISIISRLDFSNETVSDPGKNLPIGRGAASATSSSFYGYFGAGSIGNVFPSHISTITRLDFSNETVSDPGKNLPTARYSLAATSSNSYGYFGGGVSASNDHDSTISRLDFSNESISNPGKNLYSLSLLGVSDLAVTSSNSYGYFGGGYYFDGPSEFATIYNTIVRLDFSNETISLPGKNLPTARAYLAAVSSSSYGYFAGGGSPGINTISRLDFSNETVSDPGKNLPTARYYLAATSSSYYGYFGGDGVTLNNTISRLDFSNETVSNPGKNLPTERNRLTAVSNSN